MRFVLTVLAVWGLMHLYAWLRIKGYAALSPWWAGTLGVLLLALMIAPIAGIALNRVGHVKVSRVVARVGMVWSGAFFLFFWVSLLHDLYNGLLTVASLAVPAAGSARVLGVRPLVAEAVLVTLIGLYSMLEARRIVSEHLSVTSPKLHSAPDGLRIVQISDVHLGLTVGKRRLWRIVRAVRAARPDLLVSTGDLVDAEAGDMAGLAEMLADIKAPLGKYAVTGNHEYYAGLDQALEFTRRSGFTVLSNELVRPRQGLTVAGFNDGSAHNWGDRNGPAESEVLRQAAEGDYVLVLKHRPMVRPESLPLLDLQLSGHTHGGQVFPFTLFVRSYYARRDGLCELAPGKYLYTSRGTGTWGPPMRFLNPPEVTVIDIQPLGPHAAAAPH